MKRETRTSAQWATELRVADDEKGLIEGYASVFSKWYSLGGFRERIMPGAFDGVLQDDVRALFNHDANFVLGRRSAGTLKISADDTGLRFSIEAPETQLVEELVLSPIRRGEIDSASFAFRVDPEHDEWKRDKDGRVSRTIKKVSELIDVGPVTFPASPATTAAVRAFIESEQPESGRRLYTAARRRLAVLKLRSPFTSDDSAERGRREP